MKAVTDRLALFSHESMNLGENPPHSRRATAAASNNTINLNAGVGFATEAMSRWHPQNGQFDKIISVRWFVRQNGTKKKNPFKLTCNFEFVLCCDASISVLNAFEFTTGFDIVLKSSGNSTFYWSPIQLKSNWTELIRSASYQYYGFLLLLFLLLRVHLLFVCAMLWSWKVISIVGTSSTKLKP